MKRSLAVVVALLIVASLTNAQGPGTAAKPSSVAGTVVKEPGSEPLKKVLVQVLAEDPKQGGSYTAATDGDGHFRVDNVVPGRYRIFFEKAGFAGVNGRGVKADVNVFTVQAGQSVEDLVFRMLATAVISGRITDEDGDPLSEVRIAAQQRRPGKSTRESIGMATTNDLGEYRLAGLFPGQYWITAMPPPDFRDYEELQKSNSSNNKDDTQHDNKDVSPIDTRYLATYYPGTFDAMQASPVTLKAGEEMPVNFTLVPARTYRVRGIVTGIPIPAGQKPAVEVLTKDGNIVRGTEVRPDGQFEVTGVGPGSYVLAASAGTDMQLLTAHQSLNIVAADVDGVKLTPISSFSLNGHLRIEGGMAGDVPQYSINLARDQSSEDPDAFMFQQFYGENAPVDRMGNFEWKKVNPGKYIVQLFGGAAQNNFYLKSVLLGGRDVTTGFTVTGPAALDILVSSKGGIVEGTVVEKEKDVSDEYPVANATVVAVPEEKYRKLPDRFVAGATDQHGHFTLRGLAPGSYTLYAWQDLEDGTWYDADFLKSQETNGAAVKVEEGSNQKVELKLSPAGEEWR